MNTACAEKALDEQWDPNVALCMPGWNDERAAEQTFHSGSDGMEAWIRLETCLSIGMGSAFQRRKGMNTLRAKQESANESLQVKLVKILNN